MTEPAYLTTARESYDAVADAYADLIPDRFSSFALGRAMLANFAELVGPSGRQVADVGCGPGYVTAQVGFHVRNEGLQPERSYGFPVTYSAYLRDPDDVGAMLEQAGFSVTARMITDDVKRPQACLQACRNARPG